MPLSKKNYKDIYKLQDKVLSKLKGKFGNFYLTGGTALGRFYLSHRHSDDLDLFSNADPDFTKYVDVIRRTLSDFFQLSDTKIMLYEDFVRLWIDDDTGLKIEIVNDVAKRWGEIYMCNEIPVDNPGNILANKLTALVSRDEPKDIYDIVCISSNFSFNWEEVFQYSLQKSLINEPDVAIRLKSFPVALLSESEWLKEEADQLDFKKKLSVIADDFLFAKDNSLGNGKVQITEARPFQVPDNKF